MMTSNIERLKHAGIAHIYLAMLRKQELARKSQENAAERAAITRGSRRIEPARYDRELRNGRARLISGLHERQENPS
jgi:hypothetical protein